MPSLRIETSTTPTGVAARLHTDDGALDGTIRVDCATTPLAAEPDVFLAPGLLLGMATGHDVEMATADRVALERARRADELLHDWFPSNLRPVQVHADPATSSPDRTPAGVGCFFSGGVDSFHSALRNLDEVTHLVFVHGFDIFLTQSELRERASRAAHEAAADLGKPLIEVTTDIRDISDRHLDWGKHFHGAAMGMVAQALRGHLAKVIVPSTHHVKDLHPFGSHPELDPLWSSSMLELVHDGEEVTRVQKVAEIIDSRAAMEHLRVCWENPNQEYNCGRCEKCVRTMVNLAAVGALGRCRTLPATVDLDVLRGTTLTKGTRIFARQNVAALRASGTRNPELLRALRGVIWSGRMRDLRAAIKDRVRIRR